jgi:hypothetical protein
LAETVLRISGVGYKKWAKNSWNIYGAIVLAGLFPVTFVRLCNLDAYFGIEDTLAKTQVVLLDAMVLRLIELVPLLHVFFKTMK